MTMSRRVRLCAVAVALGLVGGALGPVAPAQARRPARVFTKGKNFDYRKIKRKLSKVKYGPGKIIRDKVNVPVSTPEDGNPGEVKLHVEIVRPKRVRPYATILELSPYHGTLADRSGARILPGPKKNPVPPWVDTEGGNLGLAGYFAPRGYAVVFVDLRGTGKSGGCLDHLGQKDKKDSKDIINWIAKQPWSNGRVGMTGHSYVGSTPSMAAAAGPKALKTIVPSAGLAAMYHHKFQDGVPYFLQYIGPAEAYEQLTVQRYLLPQLGDEYGDSFGENVEWFGCGAPNSALVSGDDFDAGAYDDDPPFFWDQRRDHRKGATKARIPVFAVHGVNDNAARIPALDWFLKRNSRKRHDKGWIGQWDHGSDRFPNDRTCEQHAAAAAPCKNDQWTLALHAWFDKHLKKRKVPTGPPFEIFLNNRKVYQPKEWPPRARRRKFFLSPTGKLKRGKKKLKEASTKTYVASKDGEVDEYTEEGPNSLAWTSAPMKKKTLLAGTPKLKLWEDQTVERMHVIGTLYDIAPNGDVVCMPIAGGSSRCGISKATFAMNPELRKTIKEITPVVPGEVMKLKMKGMTQAYVLKKRHRLRFVLASSQPDKVANHAEGSVTVHMGAKRLSRVIVPVVRRARLRHDTFWGG